MKELITSHFMTSQTQFCGFISDKKIFHCDFLYYICSYRLGSPICTITGHSGTKTTTLTYKYFARGNFFPGKTQTSNFEKSYLS